MVDEIELAQINHKERVENFYKNGSLVAGFPSVGGVMVSIDAFQALDPGSIPGHRKLFSLVFCQPIKRRKPAKTRRDRRVFSTTILGRKSRICNFQRRSGIL